MRPRGVFLSRRARGTLSPDVRVRLVAARDELRAELAEESPGTLRARLVVARDELRTELAQARSSPTVRPRRRVRL